MNSTGDWWKAEVDWSTPAGRLLQKFIAGLPASRHFEITLYGSAPLQFTVDPTLLSADVDVFSNDDADLNPVIASLRLDKTHGGLQWEKYLVAA